MNEVSTWIWLAGWLLIAVAVVIAICPLLYAVSIIRKLRLMSGMRTWAEMNVFGLILGFFPPFGTAMAIQGGRLIGHEFDHLLTPVLLVCIPILAATVVSSFLRLIRSGITGPRSDQPETGPKKPGRSRPDRTESK